LHTLFVASHAFVPCEFVHTSPHFEQFVAVPSGVSQPLAVLPSQLAKPALQLPNVQVPVVHDALAFGKLHLTLQSPQSVSVLTLRSQPLSALPSQLLKPLLHTGEQDAAPGEPTQLFTLFNETQALPQDAQSVFVPSGVSQPALAVQSAKPALQPVSTQLPVAQEEVPCGSEHGVAQLPQSVSVLSGVSQPLSGLPSQLLKPAVQAGAHAKLPAEPLHEVVPWPFVQVSPQLPQFEVVPSCTSQPLAVLLSQFAKPALQAVNVHVPVLHEADALGNEQATLQLPQSVSVRTLRSQPLSGLPSQLLKPALQLGLQAYAPAEPLHAVVPFCAVQTWPQALQFVTVSSCVSQLPFESQSSVPGSHVVATQLPVAHDSAEFGTSQAVLHVPQLVRLVRLVSQPLFGFESQSPKSDPLQLKVQPVLVLQAAVPCAFVHDSPQVRQFAVVPEVVSQPAWLVQSKKPALQAETTQLPVEHEDTAFGRLQVAPQSPQFVSVRTSVSQPFARLPSQLLNPVAQLGLHAKFGAVPPHEVEPWPLLHTSPQVLQFELVPSWVSQPA
jgi:hypothetical protein